MAQASQKIALLHRKNTQRVIFVIPLPEILHIRISHRAINFMRREILKFCFAQIRRAAKFYVTNKSYCYVAGIDNLLVYSAKLTHAAVNFMF